VTRHTGPTSAGRAGSDVKGRPDLPQGARWDLDLLTPDDVCALLKVRKSWLYDTVEAGAIEAVRLGKQLRFRPSALFHYIEEHEIKRNFLDTDKNS
jgi:excisionase family DNA binding protein